MKREACSCKIVLAKTQMYIHTYWPSQLHIECKHALSGLFQQHTGLSCACKRAGRRRQDGYEFVALGPANLPFWLNVLLTCAKLKVLRLGLANLPFWLKVLLTYAKLKVLRTYAKLAAI